MAFRFPVEASHIMMFARSVGDKNPLYYDADYAEGFVMWRGLGVDGHPMTGSFSFEVK